MELLYKKNLKNNGFTLVELMVVIGVILLAAILAFTNLITFTETTNLSSTVDQILVVLHDARSRTLASVSKSQHGVHLQNDRVVLFAGTSYTPGDPDNEEQFLSGRIEMVSINLAGGGADVIFQRSTGQTIQFGTFNVRSKRNTSIQSDIDILPSGTATIRR